MVAADEPNARKHMELESVPNLQVYRTLSTVKVQRDFYDIVKNEF